MNAEEISQLQLGVPHWSAIESHHLRRQFDFPDFRTALAFVNRVGAIAEEQGHHPDLHLTWGRVEITIWTHSAGGLTQSDFVLASKIDREPQKELPDDLPRQVGEFEGD